MNWKFAGRFMSSIDDAVDSGFSEAKMDAMLEREPTELLISARNHIADHRTVDGGDVTAWERLGRIIDCLFSGLTDECQCGRMEGEHSHVGEICPDELFGYFLPRSVKAARARA